MYLHYINKIAKLLIKSGHKSKRFATSEIIFCFIFCQYIEWLQDKSVTLFLYMEKINKIAKLLIKNGHKSKKKATSEITFCFIFCQYIGRLQDKSVWYMAGSDQYWQVLPVQLALATRPVTDLWLEVGHVVDQQQLVLAQLGIVRLGGGHGRLELGDAQLGTA